MQRLCEMVAELGLPPTLVHGDLHQENAVLTEGGFRLFDWSDACVSMPLFDLHELDRMEDPG